jgi:hypothetical protein
MKLNPVASQAAIGAYQAQNLVNGYLPTSVERVSATEEVIGFSPTFGRLKEAMEARTPEELAHIEEITRQIREGAYHVPSDIVAAKIVDEYLHFNK